MDKLQEVDKILKEIEKMKREVPFGNSDFQIQNFIANDITPERCFRNTILQLNQKIVALHESKFRRERYVIDIDEAKDSLNKDSIDVFEKRRLSVLIEEKGFYLKNEEKLIDDCIRECNIYYFVLKKLPDIDRNKFEEAERDYWTKRITSDATKEAATGRFEKGTIDAIGKLGIDMKREGNIITFIPQETKKIGG